MPVAGDVLDRDLAGLVQPGGDDADGRFDAVLAGRDAAQVGQGRHQPDRAVAAHVQIADVVEEDHAGRRAGIVRRQEDCADQHVRPAGLVDDGRAKPVELRAKAFAPLGHAAAAEIRPAVDHHPRRLAAGMRIDDAGRGLSRGLAY